MPLLCAIRRRKSSTVCSQQGRDSNPDRRHRAKEARPKGAPKRGQREIKGGLRGVVQRRYSPVQALFSALYRDNYMISLAYLSSGTAVQLEQHFFSYLFREGPPDAAPDTPQTRGGLPPLGQVRERGTTIL